MSKLNELERALKPKLTDEFLATLTKAARTCGWLMDYVEVRNFVEWCYDIANKPIPLGDNLEPFDDE